MTELSSSVAAADDIEIAVAPPHSKSRWRLWLGLALLGALGAVAAPWLSRLGAKGPQWSTAVIERGSLEKTVTAVGSLQAKDYVDVGTQVSGQLDELHVDIGDRVEKGDLIAEIDPTVYTAAVRTTGANLRNLVAQKKQIQAELELARLQLERNQRMLAERAVSQNTVDSLAASLRVNEAQVEALDAQIAGTRASLQGDQANLAFTKVYAPMGGTVTDKEAIEGSTLNAVQSAPTLVTISNLDVMTVWAQVAEADVHKVKAGTRAYFTTLGMADRRWEAVVRQVQPTPETDNDVVLYNVLLDVGNEEGVLLPEMTVQVFFVLDSVQDAPLVPLRALRPSADGGDGAYWADVLVGEKTETRAVKVRLANRQTGAVESGLEAGDRVIVGRAEPDAPSGDSPRGPKMGPML